MASYFELGIAALLPALVAVMLFALEKDGKFSKISKSTRNILFGIIFGILAICGTEFGVPMNGAQINCRDASVLIGGLIFGWRVGIIAGVIGAVERWIAVAWGIGAYTRLACTLATFFAGIFSALISKFMLEDKKPTWGMAMFIAIAVEVFHMMMVFYTNVSDATKAIVVVRSCTVPMILANSISVLLAVLFVSMSAHELKIFKVKEKSERPVFETVQRGMLQVIFLCLVVTCVFVYVLENNMSVSDTKSILNTSVEDAADELNSKVDDSLVEESKIIVKEIELSDKNNLNKIVKKYDVDEISIVNKDGIVEYSSLNKFVGYDINSNIKSSEFMCLIYGHKQYVQKYQSVYEDRDIYRKVVGVKSGDGFILLCYDSDCIYDNVSSEIEDLIKYRNVGQNGFMVITDSEGNVISNSNNIDSESFKDAFKGLEDTEGDMELGSFNGEQYYYCSEECEEYNLVAIYPVSEANIQRDIMVYLTIFQIILVFMAIYIVLYMIIKKVVVDQIVKMANSLSVISSGHLDEVVNVRNNREFASLSNDINQTVDTLKRYIKEAAARIDQELAVARQIQVSTLPNPDTAFKKRTDFEIFAKMAPAKEVGGDFYDFYMTSENELNVMIADVSGKGIPAAMFMMRAKSTLKDLADEGYEVNKVFDEGNKSLCNGNDAEMFVTAWQGKIHLDTGIVEYADAGHNPPLVKRGNGNFEYLNNKKNLVLAAMDGITYRKHEMQLEPGDVILLYTDGVVEATNKSDELYGEDRLLTIANSHNFGSMEELIAVIRSDVDSFVGEAPQFDDLTMLAFKYKGEEERLSGEKLSKGIADKKAEVIDLMNKNEIKVDPQNTELTLIQEFLEKEMENQNVGAKLIYRINIAVDEIYSNIVKYSKANDASVSILVADERICVILKDNGIPFNPMASTDPDISLSADEREIGGLGIFMTKKMMDEVIYNYDNGYNSTTLILKRK